MLIAIVFVNSYLRQIAIRIILVLKTNNWKGSSKEIIKKTNKTTNERKLQNKIIIKIAFVSAMWMQKHRI